MGTNKTIYRVSGSAALKPEYVDQESSSAPIIDFESVRSGSCADWREDMNFRQTTSWASSRSCEHSFVDSLKRAFIDRSKVSAVESHEVARVLGILAVISLVVAFFGA